jgi:hypothetical protein
MGKTFINTLLKNDIKELQKNLKVIEITKGDVSGNSIEIYEKITKSYNSYVYYSRSIDRDKDYQLLLEMLESKLEENE